MNWSALLKTLGMAAAAGAATGLQQYWAGGNTNPKEMGTAAAVGAVTAVIAYLMPQPHAKPVVDPLPPVDPAGK